MAAILVNNFRSHGSFKKSVPEDSTETKLSMIPDEKDREFDIELGVLMLNGYFF
jgi:hypothetical protein